MTLDEAQTIGKAQRAGPVDGNSPIISVIIPHYNDLANLDICLRLIAKQSLSSEAFEVVVADNNSPCGLAAVEAVCAGLARVVPAPIQGAAEARNAAVRAARGQYLAFIDSDCRPYPEWLEAGLQALEHGDLVGGSVELVTEDPQNPTAIEAFELIFAFNTKRYIEKVGFSITANMFVSRETFNEVGDFRSGVAEDFDWGRRAVALGHQWRYEPQARLSHPARRTWAELESKWRRLVREGYRTTKEQPLGTLKWVLRTWLILLSPFLHTFHILRSNRLGTWSLRLKATRILFQLRWWRFKQSYIVMFARQ